jgi:endonuclease YncB( thermonuclease family)
LDQQASELGITPEQALASGEESKSYVELALGNQPLYIEAENGLTDRFGRQLAYVWTGEGELLNLMLLSSGRARVYEGGKPFAREAEFLAAEREARARGVGMWALPRVGKTAPLPGPDFPWPVVFGLALLAAILVWLGYRR